MTNDLRKFLLETFSYCDGVLYWKKKTAIKTKIGSVAGTKRSDGYHKIHLKEHPIMVHRAVFLMHHGYLPRIVDHIDGNKSNNKIENLREANPTQSSYNTSKKSCNTSGFKNVYWRASRSKWIVALRIYGKSKCFGSFDDIELADLVATEARNKYHEGFQKHN